MTGLAVGLGDGVASMAPAGIARATIRVEDTTAIENERLKIDIYLKIDERLARERLPRRRSERDSSNPAAI